MVDCNSDNRSDDEARNPFPLADDQPSGGTDPEMADLAVQLRRSRRCSAHRFSRGSCRRRTLVCRRCLDACCPP